MAEKKNSMLSKLNIFSPVFRKVENVSNEDVIRKQSVQNSIGFSESDASEMKRAIKQFMGNETDYDGSIAAYHQIETMAQAVNKTQKIKQYREMEKYPECSESIDYICDEAIFVDSDQRICTLNFKRNIPPAIKRIIEAEFDYITYDAMELHENGWRWFRRWLVDAEFFGEIVLNDAGNRVISVKHLNPAITFPIYNGDEILYYMQKNTNSFSVAGMGYAYNSGVEDMLRLNRSQVVYANYGEYGSSYLDVNGFLEPAKLPFNHLKNLEIALLLYRLVRAPERYVFNVEVGKMPVQKGREYLQKLKAEHRKEEFYDAESGEVDIFSSFMTVLKDFWFMKRAGEGSSVETIGGTMDLGAINDVEHFLKKLYRSMKIPKSRWSEENNMTTFGKPGDLTYEEHKFILMVNRMRSQFLKVIRDTFFLQLKLDGVPAEYISHDFLSIEYTNANLFQKEKELMVLGSELEQLNTASQFIIDAEGKGVYDKEYILRRIMGDSEYERNEEMRLANEEKKKLGQEQGEVEAGSGGGGGMDMGGDTLGGNAEAESVGGEPTPEETPPEGETPPEAAEPEAGGVPEDTTI